MATQIGRFGAARVVARAVSTARRSVVRCQASLLARCQGVIQGRQAGVQVFMLVGAGPGPDHGGQWPGQADRYVDGHAVDLQELVAQHLRWRAVGRDACEPVIAAGGEVAQVFDRQSALRGQFRVAGLPCVFPGALVDADQGVVGADVRREVVDDDDRPAGVRRKADGGVRPGIAALVTLALACAASVTVTRAWSPSSVRWPAASAARSPVTVQPVMKSGGPTSAVICRAVSRGRSRTWRMASMTAAGRNGGLVACRWVLPLISPMGTGTIWPRSAASATWPTGDNRASVYSTGSAPQRPGIARARHEHRRVGHGHVPRALAQRVPVMAAPFEQAVHPAV